MKKGPGKSPKHITDMSAEQLIRRIATDYIELSYDKVQWLYLEHIQWCRDWLLENIPPDPEAEKAFQNPIDDNF